MKRTVDTVRHIFSQNRAEELGYDVWEHFVVPPFYHLLDLQTARKPRLIIGGRGCGKTMLLRYLSHQSAFSPPRPYIPSEAIAHIGVYWRADTQFSNAMHRRDISDDTWEAAFGHMAALILGAEVLSSLDSMSNSRSPLLEGIETGKLDLRRLQAFDPTLPTSQTGLRENLEERLWAFESWVNDVRKVNEPKFLPGRSFVLALIQEIQRQVPALSGSTYSVYLDEYENLRPYQKRVINTWLKHSERPLIFNLAMKRNSFDVRETTGQESLSDIHDFRQHDLEAYFLASDATVFFAEIMLLQMAMAGTSDKMPIDAALVRDPSKLRDRQEIGYKRRVLAAVERMFPDISEDDLALSVFQDPALLNKLRERIELALRQRNAKIAPDYFLKSELAKAAIVVPALLHRRKLQPSEVAEEFNKLETGIPNRFTGRTNWIHNNFIGGLLQLYEPHSRACPFYAGFRTFLQLARGNIRHFLELCHKSIYRAFNEEIDIGQPILFAFQAEAARQASKAFLGEVRSFGPHGHQLHTFVLRLGSLFALAHQRPTVSESEQSHFSIGPGIEILKPEDHAFLREATKWSVLFEEEETKKKQDYTPTSLEYVLNPIYAPYFHISYRKKKKLELSAADLICLMRGSYDEVSSLLRQYSRRWSVEPHEMTPTLFSHLTSERPNED